VASAALYGSIVACAVNRAIHYNDIWRLDEGVAWSCTKFGTERFRKSLSVAGSVLGPASFWAGISPVLKQGREILLGTDTSIITHPLNCGLVIAEHFVPFLLAYGLMNLKIVKNDPDRFVVLMSSTAGMLSAVVEGPFVTLRAATINAWKNLLPSKKATN
jgi:hypothetical protein